MAKLEGIADGYEGIWTPDDEKIGMSIAGRRARIRDTASGIAVVESPQKDVPHEGKILDIAKYLGRVVDRFRARSQGQLTGEEQNTLANILGQTYQVKRKGNILYVTRIGSAEDAVEAVVDEYYGAASRLNTSQARRAATAAGLVALVGVAGCSCFPKGTKILMKDGSKKNIEDVKIGEMVLGHDGKNNVPVKVLELEAPIRDHLYALHFEDGSMLELTREHPLFTQEGWKSLSPKDTAKENAELKVNLLKVDDQVLNTNGKFIKIIKITSKQENVQTYNLKRVSEHNNFFANGFLAHNKGGGPGPTPGLTNPHATLYDEVIETAPATVEMTDSAGNIVTVPLIFNGSNPVALAKDYFGRVSFAGPQADMDAILRGLDTWEQVSGVAIPFSGSKYDGKLFLRVEVTDPSKEANIGNITDTNSDGTKDYIALLTAGNTSKQVVIPQATIDELGRYVYARITDVDADTLLGFYTAANPQKILMADKNVLKQIGQGNALVSVDLLYNTQTHGVSEDVFIYDTSSTRMTQGDIDTVKAFYAANNGKRASQNMRIIVFTDDSAKLDKNNSNYVAQAIDITKLKVDKGLWTPGFDQ